VDWKQIREAHLSDSEPSEGNAAAAKSGATGKALIDAGGATAGAAIGLLMGGPAGALVGAAAGPMIACLSDLALKRAAVFWDALRDAIAERDLSEAQWTEEVEKQPSVQNAVLEIVAAAGQTADPARLKALGQLAARIPGMDPEEVAAAEYFASVLNALRAVHFNTLHLMEASWNERHDPLGLTPDEILAGMGVERTLARSIMRTLELHGLIMDNARLSREIVGVFWELTDLGRRFLAFSKPAATIPERSNDAAPE
jgi:hypothetical protein